MLTVLLKLILSHIIGDFLFQSSSLVQRRKENVWYLLLHVLIHFVVMLVLFVNELDSLWIPILSISLAHLAIDSLKIWMEKTWNILSPILFVLDQLLHLAVILIVVFSMYGIPQGIFEVLFNDKSILYIIAFLLSTVVTPVFLRIFFTKWSKESEFQDKRNTTLIDAGTLIGILERLIIILFIQLGLLEGIGFLLAAKSIFRFGDLTNAKDTKFTEYVLLGTLMSFVIAIVIGYLLLLSLRYIENI